LPELELILGTPMNKLSCSFSLSSKLNQLAVVEAESTTLEEAIFHFHLAKAWAVVRIIASKDHP
jgi:hypothetical protein